VTLSKCIGCGSVWFKPYVSFAERDNPREQPRVDDVCSSCAKDSSVTAKTYVTKDNNCKFLGDADCQEAAECPCGKYGKIPEEGMQ